MKKENESKWRGIVAMSLGLAGSLWMSDLALADQTGPETVKTQILKIEAPTSSDGMYSVLSTADGRVYSVTGANVRLLEQLKTLAVFRLPVKLEIVDDTVMGATALTGLEANAYNDAVGDISTPELNAGVEGQPQPESGQESAATAIDALVRPEALDRPAAIVEFEQYGYHPTILNSMGDAHQLFALERPLKHSSQCHQRAMVWTYDLYRARGTQSMKVIMFYTEKLRKTYTKKGFFGTKPYKWWYHTAPYVYVGDQEVVLDSEFMRSEVSLDEWTNHFIGQETLNYTDNHSAPRLGPDATLCHVMKRYQEYSNQNGQDWCMVRKFPMYYMQPNSVEALDCNPSRDKDQAGRPCFHRVLAGFDPNFLKNAYSGAPQR